MKNKSDLRSYSSFENMDHNVYFILYNLYKDSCPLIGWIAFNILTIYRLRWQKILLHSVWVAKSAKIIYYCTQPSHLR